MFAEFNGSRNLGEKITGRIKIYSTRDFFAFTHDLVCSKKLYYLDYNMLSTRSGLPVENIFYNLS